MTMQEMMSLTVDDIDLILRDQLDLYTDDEIQELKQWRDFLLAQAEKSKSEEAEKERRVHSNELKAIKCPKCDGLNDATSTHCIYCDYILRDGKASKESDDNDQSASSASLILSIIISCISIALTVIVRNGMDEKIDLTPEAWGATWALAVPDHLKLFVYMVPIVFTIITSAMRRRMRKEEKIFAGIVEFVSLVVAIIIINSNYKL